MMIMAGEHPRSFAWRRARRLVLVALVLIACTIGFFRTASWLEVAVAPPVKEWRILEATRTGNELRWFVLVDKNRDCQANVRYIGRWENQSAVLAASWANGRGADRASVNVPAGERAVLGPIYAPVPRGWHEGSKIVVEADVDYRCGSPWPLPPITPKAEAK